MHSSDNSIVHFLCLPHNNHYEKSKQALADLNTVSSGILISFMFILDIVVLKRK